MSEYYSYHERKSDLLEDGSCPRCYKCGEPLEEWPDYDEELLCDDCLEEELSYLEEGEQ
jgi:formylmethanofuran dehydrogenase subunit E